MTSSSSDDSLDQSPYKTSALQIVLQKYLIHYEQYQWVWVSVFNLQSVRESDTAFPNLSKIPYHPDLAWGPRPYWGLRPSALSSDTAVKFSTLQLEEKGWAPFREKRSVETKRNYLTEFELTQCEEDSPQFFDHSYQVGWVIFKKAD